MKETRRNLIFQILFAISIPLIPIFIGCYAYFGYKAVDESDMVSLNVSLNSASYEGKRLSNFQLEFSFTEYQATFIIRYVALNAFNQESNLAKGDQLLSLIHI